MERADVYRQKDRLRLRQLVTTKGLGALDQNDFYKVIKWNCEDGNFHDDFVAETLKRIAGDSLLPRDYYCLIMDSPENTKGEVVISAAFRWLNQNQGHSQSIITMASQEFSFPAPEYICQEIRGRMTIFSVVGKITDGTDNLLSREHKSLTKKKAINAAGCDLAALLVGVQPEKYFEQLNEVVPAIPATATTSSSNEQHPKSILMMLSHQHKFGKPEFSVKVSGLSHQTIHKVVGRIKIGEAELVSEESQAGTLKEAEKIAAADLLQKLQPLLADKSEGATRVKYSPKHIVRQVRTSEVLKVFCAEKGHGIPEYHYQEMCPEVDGCDAIFCQVTLADGEVVRKYARQKYNASAPLHKKKVWMNSAQEYAALLVLNALKERFAPAP